MPPSGRPDRWHTACLHGRQREQENFWLSGDGLGVTAVKSRSVIASAAHYQTVSKSKLKTLLLLRGKKKKKRVLRQDNDLSLIRNEKMRKKKSSLGCLRLSDASLTATHFQTLSNFLLKLCDSQLKQILCNHHFQTHSLKLNPTSRLLTQQANKPISRLFRFHYVRICAWRGYFVYLASSRIQCIDRFF